MARTAARARSHGRGGRQWAAHHQHTCKQANIKPNTYVSNCSSPSPQVHKSLAAAGSRVVYALDYDSRRKRA